MRTLIFSLLLVSAAALSLPAQPVPTLEAATDRELYRADATNKIYIAAHIGSALPNAPVTQPSNAPSDLPSEASAKESATTTVRNIAFVLDRSGSMTGTPIQTVRQALATALASLADRDIVSVVLFGSEVEILIPAQRRDQLGNLDTLLAQIEPAGGAALYDALNQGAAQLRRLASPSSSNHLILLTDGPATKGPREMEDFTKLAEALSREGITLSTIGLGPDFNEDQLAALARMGDGHFRFAHKPEQIPSTFLAEIEPRRTLLARDAVLTIEFAPDCDEPVAYGWKQADIKLTTLTYRLPFLFADQPIHLLASATLRGRRSSHRVATLSLTWHDLTDGKSHELKQQLEIFFETDADAIRKSVNAATLRTTATTLISEGFQKAIEQMDKGDLRRAFRFLRNTRSDAYSLNYDLEDPFITAKIKLLEAYLAEVEPRGLNPLDRKILRSGLYNAFDSPTEDPKDKK
jgi:Ca-activated chloride channel homolog